MRKFLVAIALIAGVTFATAVSSDAITFNPTPTVTSSCNQLKVTLNWYQQPRGARLNNRVTITVDGVSFSQDFGTLYSVTIPWTENKEHSYTVVVDANRIQGLPLVYDSTINGVQVACAVA